MSMDTNILALKQLYIALGGAASDFNEIATNPRAISQIALLYGIKSDVVVSAENGSTDMWGTLVSDMQTNVAVSGNAITGSLAYLSSGQLVTDWGAGNFLALKFTKPNGITSVKVELVPSASDMPLQELDEDLNGVFKITDKDTQILRVQYSDGNATKVADYTLSGLTVAGEA